MSNIKKKFLSGIFYTSIAKYTGLFISIGVTAVLARLLSPNDFGVIAIATVFINFFATLTTVGISPAIIQNKTIDKKDLISINSFTALIAVSFTGIYLILIPSIANFYTNEALKDILFYLSINIFFSILSIVPNALLLKDKRFKFIAIRTFTIQFILGIISIIAAYNGMGIYALTLSPIGSSILLFIISYKAYPIKFGKIKKNSISKILSFSIFQMIFNFLYLGYRNIDKILIGKYWGVSNLGYYEKSYRLMMLPLENVSTIIAPVLHPLLSDYQKDYPYLWNVYKKMLAFLSEFSFIISVVLYYLAEVIILGFYGDQWINAIPIFKVLSLSICFQLLQAPIGAILQAANSVQTLVLSSVYIFIVMIICLLCAILLNDFNIVSYMIDIAFAIGFIIYQIFICKTFNASIIELIKIVFPHFFYAIILFIILHLNNYWIESDLWEGAIMVILISTTYYILLSYLNITKNTRKILTEILKSRK